jgi:Endosomal/lysosomal potassium channel TMEM175
MTRLETFIDAAFAFAITMLMIATQQIPDDIETLLAAFKNMPAFVASIIVLGRFSVPCGFCSAAVASVMYLARILNRNSAFSSRFLH